MIDCDRFEQAWQHHFDGESLCPPSDLAGWDEHLLACADCQAVDRRFRALGLALNHWSETQPARGPQPASGSAGDRRVPARARGSRRAARRWQGVAAGGLAIAASLALAGIGPGMRGDRREPAAARPAAVAPPTAALANPLVDASTVTARLARVASIPATLFGRDRLASGAPEEPAEPPTDPLDGAPARLRELGGRVFASFQPLTLRAREAFDFVVPGRPAGHEDREPTGRGA